MDKPIKLAGFSAATPLARQLIASNPDMISLEQVPMLAVFTLESTTFDFVGPQHVPHLRLEGHLNRLIPEDPQAMPYRIGEIGLSEEESIRVVGDYPFTVDQLSSLVHKGLYLEGFGPSEDWLGLPFEVDTQIDLKILPPNQEGSPPLVIADLSPMHFFDMRLETSRYDLAEHFPDYRQSLIQAGKITGNEALSFDPLLTQAQSDLSGFSFAGPSRDEKHRQQSPIGVGDKGMIKRLSELMEVDLSAPEALRGLHEETRGEQIRAERARADLRSPGLAELYGETVAYSEATTSAAPENDNDELTKMVEQLDDMDLEDLDLSGFSFGDEEDGVKPGEPGEEAGDDELVPTLTLSESGQEELTATVIAEDDGFTFADEAEDDQAVRARKARLAREAAARRARQNQQADVAKQLLPEGNAAPKPDHDGPQPGN